MTTETEPAFADETRSPPLRQTVAGTLFWARLHFKRNLTKRAFKMWLALLVVSVLGARAFASGAKHGLADQALVFVTPLLGLFFGAGSMREEIEDQTLTYGFTRPISPSWLYVARVASNVATVALLAAPTAAISAGGSSMAKFAIAALLASLLYTSFFGLIGMLFRSPTWFGVAFVLLWEGGVGLVPGYLGRMTFVTYIRALADIPIPIAPLRAYWIAPSPIASVAVPLAAAVLFLALGGQIARRREFVLER